MTLLNILKEVPQTVKWILDSLNELNKINDLPLRTYTEN